MKWKWIINSRIKKFWKKAPMLDHWFKDNFWESFFRLHYGLSKSDTNSYSLINNLIKDIYSWDVWLYLGVYVSTDPDVHNIQTKKELELVSELRINYIENNYLDYLKENDFVPRELDMKMFYIALDELNEETFWIIIKEQNNDLWDNFFIADKSFSILLAPYDSWIDIVIFDNKKRELIMKKYQEFRKTVIEDSYPIINNIKK